MIRGKVMKEMMIVKPGVNYRELDSLNCSMLKLFDDDPVKFYEQFKLGKNVRNKSTVATVIGDIVDFYLLECKGDEKEFEQRYDEKFALYNGVKGSGQVFVLADLLYQATQENTNENGEMTVSFETIFQEAFNKAQTLGRYSGKTKEAALKDFNSNGKEYFKELLNSNKKTVVDFWQIEKAKQIARDIVDDSFTGELFDGSHEIEYLSKFPIEWEYTLKSNSKVNCKSEIDILRIDHAKKEIYVGDLKTTYDNEDFEIGYIKYKYYLQASFYHLAVKTWAEGEDMKDYTILPMEFVVGDTSSNNRRPIRYQTTIDDQDRGINGFYLRGVHYRGVHEIMEDINWAERNDTWNCSRELYEGNGILKLDIKYD